MSFHLAQNLQKVNLGLILESVHLVLQIFVSISASETFVSFAGCSLLVLIEMQKCSLNVAQQRNKENAWLNLLQLCPATQVRAETKATCSQMCILQGLSKKVGDINIYSSIHYLLYLNQKMKTWKNR